MGSSKRKAPRRTPDESCKWNCALIFFFKSEQDISENIVQEVTVRRSAEGSTTNF